MLKGEIAALRKNTGEAKDEKNSWATKYDALERNFKQVRRAFLFLPCLLSPTFMFTGARVYLGRNNSDCQRPLSSPVLPLCLCQLRQYEYV